MNNPTLISALRRGGAVFLLLGAGLVFCPTAGSWGVSGRGHEKITRAAFRVLPEAQRKLLAPYYEEFATYYCGFPDRGIGRAPEYKPYMLWLEPAENWRWRKTEEGGRQWHYMPLGNVENVRNFFITGAKIYMERMINLLREGEIDEALKHMGCLFHVLQDASQTGGHALEGPYGLTWQQLGEILPPPDGGHPQFSPDAATQLLLDHDGSPEFKVDIGSYRPRLLGETVEEAAFHLYEAYVRMVRDARRSTVPAYIALKEGDVHGAIGHLVKAGESSARVCADAAYTIISIAEENVPEIPEELKRVDLSTVEPVKVPSIARQPYRFTPVILNMSLGPGRTRRPLKLWVEEDGEIVKKTFESGFSSGMVDIEFDIPPQLFSHLEVTAGLHAELGREERWGQAAMEMKITLDGETAWQSGSLSRDSTAEKVRVPMITGGRLVLSSRSINSYSAADQPVWGGAVLVRAGKSSKNIEDMLDPFALAGLREGIIFRLDFENSADAVHAEGDSSPLEIVGNLKFKDGIRGRALVSGKDGAAVQYHSRKNFNMTQGSVAMWIKPIDWQGERDGRQLVRLFRQYEPSSSDGRIEIQAARWHQPWLRFSFYCQKYPGSGSAVLFYPGSRNWKNGEWRHITGTWDAEGIFTLYVDGERIRELPLLKPLSKEHFRGEFFTVGNSDADEHTAISDFSIWARPLNPLEVRALYLQGVGGVNSPAA